MQKENIIKCGLWYHDSKSGLKYANGKVVIGGKVYKVVLFNNKEKKSDKAPDFTILFQ